MSGEQVNFPVVPKWGENGELVRVLIHEEWFDRLTPLFRAFRWAESAVTVESIPDDLAQALRKTLEFMGFLTDEFGAFGWGFSLSLISLMQWAASKGISIGKFVYEEVGGYGQGRYGEMRYGESIEIVTEITE